MLGNAQAGAHPRMRSIRGCATGGKGPQNSRLLPRPGPPPLAGEGVGGGSEGEKVVQETTGARGDASGQASPTGSKAKQRQRDGPSHLSLG